MNIENDRRKAYEIFKEGTVIPAMPLALNVKHKLDERRQRALIRYYLDAGAGGLAVGVHTTQFEIRDPEVNLFGPLLNIARQERDTFFKNSGKQIILIAGVTGDTKQAVQEAELAAKQGYHAILLSLKDLKDKPDSMLLNHCRTVADILPVVGFYLQEPVGGSRLGFEFWREFAEIENVIGIKIAPFNRYRTLDVVRAVIESGRSDNITLYTGNDDNIVADLLTEYEFTSGSKRIKKRIIGGLLGHWSVWTKSAVSLLEQIHYTIRSGGSYSELLKIGAKITDCNAAFFDAANNFRGCITGLHEVLRRQGLLEGVWTLNEAEKLEPHQKAEIDRVYDQYPELNDDEFVRKNLDKWLNQ